MQWRSETEKTHYEQGELFTPRLFIMTAFGRISSLVGNFVISIFKHSI